MACSARSKYRPTARKGMQTVMVSGTHRWQGLLGAHSPAGLKQILEENKSQRNGHSNTYESLRCLAEGVILKRTWFGALGFVSRPRPHWTPVLESDGQLGRYKQQGVSSLVRHPGAQGRGKHQVTDPAFLSNIDTLFNVDFVLHFLRFY